MKTLKFLTATFAMLVISIAAQGQTTPQTIIGQSPALPTVETLVITTVTYDVDLFTAMFAQKVDSLEKVKAAFHDKINSLQQQRNEIADAANAAMEIAGRRDADRIARQQTGRSVSQLENMSESQLMAMASQMAGQRTAAAGMGNMSIAQLQALENMSEEEVVKAFQGANAAQAGAQPQAANTQAQAELRRINDRWAEIDRQNNRDIALATDELEKIYEKHKENLNEKVKILQQFTDGEMDQALFTAGYAPAKRSLESMQEIYLTECYTYWIGIVKQMQERVKTKLADVAAYDRLMAQTMTVGGGAMPSVGYDIAGQYLDVSAGIWILPKTINN